MKRTLSILIYLLSAYTVHAQSYCEKICSQRMIGLFDIVVKAPKPTDPVALSRWNKLSYLTASYVSLFYNMEALDNCMAIQDMTSTAMSGGQGKTSSTNPTMPGSGSAFDYMISGEVLPAKGSYKEEYLVRLTMVNRKMQVVRKGEEFIYEDLPIDGLIANGVINELKEDGNTKGVPLAQIIYKYEKQKRDKDEKYAIEPKIKMHFPQPNLKQKDAMLFEVEMMDCDDEPLKNRKIIFDAPSIGKLDKKEITTDKEGKGSLTYTAPAASGIASINAKYKYTHGSERDDEASNTDNIVIGDPNAPPFVRFDCDAHKKLPDAEKWGKEQWPAYYYNNVPGNHGFLGYWKTQLPGSVVVKVYNKKGELIETGNIPKDDKSYIEIKKEAIKRADIQIKKVNEIFEKYKSVPEYYFGLNHLLSFSYDLYKNNLDKEPDWDIKKTATDYNIDMAELLLKRVREKHDYMAADIVMHIAEQATKFKGEDKIAEYNQKLQGALKFNFSIKCHYTGAGDARPEENYEYSRLIDTWNTEGIQEKISGKITATDWEGRKTGPISYDINFAWELKRCNDDDPPLPLKKQKVEFIVGDFFGAPYLPKDPGVTGASVIPLGNLNASKSITYSRQVDAADGGKDNYQITISVIHAPR